MFWKIKTSLPPSYESSFMSVSSYSTYRQCKHRYLVLTKSSAGLFCRSFALIAVCGSSEAAMVAELLPQLDSRTLDHVGDVYTLPLTTEELRFNSGAWLQEHCLRSYRAHAVSRDWSVNVETGRGWSGIVGNGWELSRPVENCLDWSWLVENCRNKSGLVKNCRLLGNFASFLSQLGIKLFASCLSRGKGSEGQEYD
ncbi:hypothetical protein PoB_002564100 [Plakobranchus ocellatus]|uniref:SRCR domain-containing protein n=1 Tax=Plakobranchus ocellatus TaxID=259542 RepID=A0AAV3ZT29_9GAST|nr:hypothetical protein PoB_002564100 [Plakobranchus ocellatus]